MVSELSQYVYIHGIILNKWDLVLISFSLTLILSGSWFQLENSKKVWCVINLKVNLWDVTFDFQDALKDVKFKYRV